MLDLYALPFMLELNMYRRLGVHAECGWEIACFYSLLRLVSSA